MRTTIALALLILTLGQTAYADETPPPDVKVVYARRSLLAFDEIQVSGETVGPGGSYLNARRKTRFRSLILLRADFRSELTSSIDNL